jgi:hypothetical protein
MFVDILNLPELSTCSLGVKLLHTSIKAFGKVLVSIVKLVGSGYSPVKGPLSRDFRPLVFFIKQLNLGP